MSKIEVLKSVKLNYTEGEKLYPVILEEHKYLLDGTETKRLYLYVDVPEGKKSAPCPPSWTTYGGCFGFGIVLGQTWEYVTSNLSKFKLQSRNVGGRRRTNRRNRKYKNRRSMRR